MGAAGAGSAAGAASSAGRTAGAAAGLALLLSLGAIAPACAAAGSGSSGAAAGSTPTGSTPPESMSTGSPRSGSAAAADAPAPLGEPLVVTRGAMGVGFQLSIVGLSEREFVDVTEACFAEVDRLEDLLSNWSDASALSRLNANRSRGAVEVEPGLAEALEAALGFARETGGAFDPTVGALLEALGFYAQAPREPDAAERARIAERIGACRVRVEHPPDGPPRVVRAVDGIVLDLSGMAKGWAVDRVVRLLREHGVRNAFVAGGASTVYALGPGPEGEGWSFALPGPRGPEVAWLRDEAVSTSGLDTMPFGEDGERRDHVLDPRLARSGGHVRHGAVRSVFRGPSAAEADALSTALLVMGPEEGRAWFAGAWAAERRGRLVVRGAGGERVVELGAGER